MYFNSCFKTKSISKKSLIKHKQNNHHQSFPYFFIFTTDNRFFLSSKQVSFLSSVQFQEYVLELEEACWKGCCGGACKFIGVYICCIPFGGNWVLATESVCRYFAE